MEKYPRWICRNEPVAQQNARCRRSLANLGLAGQDGLAPEQPRPLLQRIRPAGPLLQCRRA